MKDLPRGGLNRQKSYCCAQISCDLDSVFNPDKRVLQTAEIIGQCNGRQMMPSEKAEIVA